ncbi:MAG: hypothetical protein C4526_12335 [Nitrospiraceae bacterium]|nr:MAG: hypothetical protein C4526_12335 [Nitrospiraceae bacterium]
MLWRSAEGYVRHWFALLGAMLVIALRPAIILMLKGSWVYRKFEVLPYQFGLETAFITTMTILIVFYAFLRWTDYRRKIHH